MEPTSPFWFKQRQAKLEKAGDFAYKASAPNQADMVLLIRLTDVNLWSAAVRHSADGPDVAATPGEFLTPTAAWEAAFELYRRVAVV